MPKLPRSGIPSSLACSLSSSIARLLRNGEDFAKRPNYRKPLGELRQGLFGDHPPDGNCRSRRGGRRIANMQHALCLLEEKIMHQGPVGEHRLGSYPGNAWLKISEGEGRAIFAALR